MKKILLCFMMLFPFVITDAHSSSCPAGYYWDNNGCTLCPNFVDSNFFDDNLYEFHKAEDSDDIESCALKLKVGGENGSKCGADTEVIYSYNKTQQKYILAKADVKPNCTLNYETDKCFLRRLEDDQVFGNRDFCGECAVLGGAYYEDAEHRCRACPDLNGNIGLDSDDYDVDNKLYNFISFSRRNTLDDFVNVAGMPDDIEAYNYNAVTFGQTGAADEEDSELAKYPVSCEVEFNYYANSSSCPKERDGSGIFTSVLYVYDFNQGKYVLAPNYDPYIYLSNDSCNDSAQNCLLAKLVPEELNEDNVNEDLCAECDFKGNYKADGWYCAACPMTFNTNLYEFVYGDDNRTCTIKLKVGGENGSKCGAGTNVQYVYNFRTKKYELSADARTVIANPCTGADNCFRPVRSIPPVLDVSEDLCVACEIGQGAYIGDDQCKSCPNFYVQCDDVNNCGNLYVYTLIGGNFSGEDSCALKLNVGEGGGSKCGDGTNVVYKYNTTERKYIRQTPYNVTKGSTGVLSLDQQPKDDKLKDYCKANCSGGYYMNNGVCEQCPAGYECPADTNDISACVNGNTSSCMKACAVNFYSEKGALECKKCPERSGATTVGSKYCNEDGTACRDWRACSATRRPVLCLNSDCGASGKIDFGDETYKDIIEILSINKSVYQKNQ